MTKLSHPRKKRASRSDSGKQSKLKSTMYLLIDTNTTTTSTSFKSGTQTNPNTQSNESPTKLPPAINPISKYKPTYAKVVENTPKAENAFNGEEDDDISIGSYRRNNYYTTIKIEMHASTKFLDNLRDKYTSLIQTLKEVDGMYLSME